MARIHQLVPENITDSDANALRIPTSIETTSKPIATVTSDPRSFIASW